MQRFTIQLGAFGLVLTGIATTAHAGGPALVINEIRVDQSGTDNDEYFELAGTPGASLDGLTYLVIGDGSGGSGTIEAVVDLTGQTIPASGLFVAAEASFTIGTADLTTNLNFENSDNVTHVLVSGFTGADADDLDTNDDGVLDVTPWSGVLDAIGLLEEINPPTGTEYAYGAALGFEDLGPDDIFVPAHAFRCDPNGTWTIGLFDPADGTDTPGAANLACAADADGDGVPDNFDNCPDDFNPGQEDCDGDGIGDVCDKVGIDCNANGLPDSCDIEQGTSQDCNLNGIPDECDLLEGVLNDDNGNGYPDECEVLPPTGLVINEIRVEQPGNENDEYIELKGDPGTQLTGLRYLVIGDGAAELGSGVIEAVINLDGAFVGFDGLFLAVEDTYTLGSIFDADLVFPAAGNALNFEGSDNVTHVLVANFFGTFGQDLDLDDDGVLDVTPWTHTIDAVAILEEPNPPTATEYAYGLALGGAEVGPDGAFLPGQVYLCTTTWTVGVFDPADPGETDTPGAANPTCASDCPADIDGSGDVGFGDVLEVLANWGPCPGCPADLDESGDVGFADLVSVLAGWGPCP